MAVDKHDNMIRPCCYNIDPSWGSFASIDEYWSSDTLKRIRNNLANGVRDPSCTLCWATEDKQQKSLRQVVLGGQRSDGDIIHTPRPSQVKLVTGSTCNLACMMCFSTVSSSYAKLWSTDTSWIMPDTKQTVRGYDVEMETYILAHVKDIQYIEALGGEPLFNRRFLELLSRLIDIGANRQITLFIITNATLLTENIVKILRKFKKTVLAVSVDGIGPVNEYQRWPSRWSDVEDNLVRASAEFDVSVLPTITALNIIHLPRLVDYCHNQNYIINNYQLVRHWPQLLPKNLPLPLQKKVSDEFKPWVDGVGDSQPLYSFIKRWDQQRNICINDFMPEWQPFIN